MKIFIRFNFFIQHLLFFSFTFFIYFLTLCPTITGGDSGELITSSYKLGVAHPPGYPLYVLLGHLFTLLPWQNVAWRMNLFSAVTATLTAGMLTLIILELRPKNIFNRVVAWSTGSLFAFSSLTWSYATIAEVFSLNNLFASVLFFLFIIYEKNKSFKKLLLLSIMAGLSLTHHHTIVFLLLPMGIRVFYLEYCLQPHPVKRLSWAFFFFLIGLIPYIYLPWASVKLLPFSWGGEEIATFHGFWNHVSRGDYGSFKLMSGGYDRDLSYALFLYFKNVFYETFYVGIPIAIYGVYKVYKNPQWRSFLWVSVSFLFFYLIGFHFLANFNLKSSLLREILSRFWQLPNLVIIIWIGIGFTEVIQATSSLVMKKLFLSFLIAITIFQLIWNYKNQDRSHLTIFKQFAKSLLVPLPSHSLFLPLGDHIVHTVIYLQQCEDLRKDVIIIPRPLLAYPWMTTLIQKNFPQVNISKIGPYRFYTDRGIGFEMKEFLDLNRGKFNIFITNLKNGEEQSWIQNYNLIPVVMTNQFLLKQENPDYRKYFNDTKKNLEDFYPELLRSQIIKFDPWIEIIWQQYWKAKAERANFLTKHIINFDEKERSHIMNDVNKTIKQLQEEDEKFRKVHNEAI